MALLFTASYPRLHEAAIPRSPPSLTVTRSKLWKGLCGGTTMKEAALDAGYGSSALASDLMLILVEARGWGLASIPLVQKTSVFVSHVLRQAQPGHVSQRSYQVSHEGCLGRGTFWSQALVRTSRRR